MTKFFCSSLLDGTYQVSRRNKGVFNPFNELAEFAILKLIGSRFFLVPVIETAVWSAVIYRGPSISPGGMSGSVMKGRANWERSLPGAPAQLRGRT